MFARLLAYQTYCALPDFRRKLAWLLVHGSILSRIRASTKSGVVHFASSSRRHDDQAFHWHCSQKAGGTYFPKPRHEVAHHGSYPNSKRRRTSLKRFTMRKSRVHRRSAFVLRSITAGESLLEYKGANHMTNCNPGALPQWHRRAYVLLRPIQRPRHRRQHWR